MSKFGISMLKIRNYICCLVIVLLLSCVSWQGLYCQESDATIPEVVSPPPISAAFAKYGEIPVNYHNGLPQIDIPLWEIKAAGHTFPISMSYHASGIRVDENAGLVGLGWTLNWGGVITQAIKGNNDLDRKNREPIAEEVKVDNYYNEAGYTWLHHGAGGDITGDYEPDIFYFSIFGRSGRFIKDDDGNFHSLPEDDVLVEPIVPLGSYWPGTGFKITYENGTAYNFEVAEACTLRTYQKKDKRDPVTNEFAENHEINFAWDIKSPYISTWYLTSIELPNSTKTITFEYNDNNYASKSSVEQTHTYYVGGWIVEDGESITKKWIRSFSLQTLQSKIPFKIVNGSEIIEFLSGGREDLLPQEAYEFIGKEETYPTTTPEQAKKITGIKIYNSQANFDAGNELKEIEFKNDTYFKSNDCDGCNLEDKYLSYRLKLDEVIIKSPNSTEEQKYTFGYEGDFMPNKESYSKDYWGYYNGADNGFYSSLPGYEISKTVSATPDPEKTYEGADRYPDEDNMKVGMLYTITYPTGGWTEFEYGAHWASKDILGDMLPPNQLNNGSTIWHHADETADESTPLGDGRIKKSYNCSFHIPSGSTGIYASVEMVNVFYNRLNTDPDNGEEDFNPYYDHMEAIIRNSSGEPVLHLKWDVDIQAELNEYGLPNMDDEYEAHGFAYFDKYGEKITRILDECNDGYCFGFYDEDQEYIKANESYSIDFIFDPAVVNNTGIPPSMALLLKYDLIVDDPNFLNNINEFMVGGLRINQITNDDGLGNKHIKKFTYSGPSLYRLPKLFHFKKALGFENGTLTVREPFIYAKFNLFGLSGKWNFQLLNSFGAHLDALTSYPTLVCVFTYNSNSVINNTSSVKSHYIGYSKVEVEELGTEDNINYTNNGKTIYEYNNQFPEINNQNDFFGIYRRYSYQNICIGGEDCDGSDMPVLYNHNYTTGVGNRNTLLTSDDDRYNNYINTKAPLSVYDLGIGSLSKVTYKDAADNPIKTESYTYDDIENDDLIHGVVFEFGSSNGFVVSGELNHPCSYKIDYDSYTIFNGRHTLRTKVTEIDGVTTTFTYGYGVNHLQPVSIRESRNNDKDQVTLLRYPLDFSEVESSEIISGLKIKHIISPVIEKIVYTDNGTGQSKEVTAAQRTDFNDFGSLLLPETVLNLETSNTIDYSGFDIGDETYMKPAVTFDYKTDGNFKEIEKTDDIIASYFWAYNHTYPVVKAINVEYDVLEPKVSESAVQATLSVIDWISDPLTEKSKWETFNEKLREKLPNSMITTYTYKPLVGMTSQTDPKGLTTYYEYDSFGRLSVVRDNDLNIIKTYEYHYQNPTP